MQLRMARAALNWTVRDLEKKTGIGRNTISRFEAGHDILANSLDCMQRTLEGAGIIFFEQDVALGTGVGLQEDFRRRGRSSEKLARKRRSNS
jgi:transcriptional regulator with XRE-family HTH domain